MLASPLSSGMRESKLRPPHAAGSRATRCVFVVKLRMIRVGRRVVSVRKSCGGVCAFRCVRLESHCRPDGKVARRRCGGCGRYGRLGLQRARIHRQERRNLAIVILAIAIAATATIFEVRLTVHIVGFVVVVVDTGRLPGPSQSATQLELPLERRLQKGENFPWEYSSFWVRCVVKKIRVLVQAITRVFTLEIQSKTQVRTCKSHESKLEKMRVASASHDSSFHSSSK